MNGNHGAAAEHGDHAMHAHPYRHLLAMAVSLLSMFLLMHAMVNTIRNVYFNPNQFYMAGLMTAPMVVIGLV